MSPSSFQKNLESNRPEQREVTQEQSDSVNIRRGESNLQNHIDQPSLNDLIRRSQRYNANLVNVPVPTNYHSSSLSYDECLVNLLNILDEAVRVPSPITNHGQNEQ
jgi:hypothetical protein